MLNEYLHRFAEKFDPRKTMDQIQACAQSKEGAIGITAALALIAGAAIYRAKKIDYGVPQVPASGLFGSSTDEYRRDPRAFITKWEKKLGAVYGAQLFGQHATVVSGPAVREVFLNEGFSFTTGIMRAFNVTLLTNNLPETVLGTDEIADAIKKYLSPNLKSYTPRVIDHLEQGLRETCGQVTDEGITLPHFFPLVQDAVARASASVFVGLELAKNEALIDSFKNMVIQIGSEVKPIPWLEPFPTLMRLRFYIIGKMSPVVQRHRDQLADALRPEVDRRLKALESGDTNWERPDDVLQDLLENVTPPAGIDMIDYLVSWLTVLVFASIHTTSENGEVVLYRLLQHPELLDELYQEQNQVLEEAGYDASVGPEVFTRELLNKFTKLDSVIRETARVRANYITLPHTNITNHPIVLSCGARILPGENCFINVYSNHNDPSLQLAIDDLNEFKPLRFAGQETNATKIGDSYLFFGMGKHACPGRWFAVQEMKTIVSLLLRKYRLESPDTITFVQQERVFFPLNPCRVKLVPRSPQA
ncbi:cytochrome P450 [Hesseltinella vesiculosa]|uniref:Cytochrome P450 n=1 Tax=Hesseltinella vesiculosa TaxID=101127 RepID=A0A1X2GSM1_9FUNG|nr:cytochrome P450 [Hesseltinella vesiculosa]